jgi:uncharacterized membrane protein YdjX (TVP38/TMEM64 family)
MSRARVITWKTLVAVLVLAAIVTAVRLLPIRDDLARFQQWVRGEGAASYLVYAVVYAIATVLFVPGSILTIGAGAIFGVVRGTIVVIAGATAGSTISFLLARTALRKRVEDLVSRNPKFQAIDRAIAREGTKIVFLIRLSVVFPFTYMNYVLGLTGVRIGPYVIATLIGTAPATVAFVYIGAIAGAAASTAGHVRLAVYVVGAATALIVSILIGRLASREINRAVR